MHMYAYTRSFHLYMYIIFISLKVQSPPDRFCFDDTATTRDVCDDIPTFIFQLDASRSFRFVLIGACLCIRLQLLR